MKLSEFRELTENMSGDTILTCSTPQLFDNNNNMVMYCTVDQDSKHCALVCKGEMDVSSALEARFEAAVENQEDELDFFTELLESGYTLADLRYSDDRYLYAKQFMEDHGLLDEDTSMTWDKMAEKYPGFPDDFSREDLTEVQETEFVDDCFSCYENEGFAKKFWTPFTDCADKIGQTFKVYSRCTTVNNDLCTLPMWKIKLEDGSSIDAHPEEIIPKEMRKNGCRLANI